MSKAQDGGSADWDAHWPKVASWMQTNPAYKYRQKLIWRTLALPAAPTPIRVLDIGCGDGSFLRSVAAFRADATLAGLDGSEEGLAIARSALTGAMLDRVDLLALPSDVSARLGGFASHALCSEVIEHVDEPVRLLAAIRPLMAPDGALVVTVPAGPMSAFDRHVGHRKHYSADTLSGECREAGWRVEVLQRAGFPFHTLYRLMVLARGEAAVDDSKGRSGAASGALSTLAFKTFDALNAFNSGDAPLGWQFVARLRPS